MYLVIPALTLLLMLAALIDIITRDDSQVQHLPRPFWIILVILIPVVGGILWFAVGRDYRPQSEFVRYGDPRRHSPGASGSSSPSSSAAARERIDHRDQRVLTTEQQLADLDREIEFYEKQARLKKLEAELGDSSTE